MAVDSASSLSAEGLNPGTRHATMDRPLARLRKKTWTDRRGRENRQRVVEKDRGCAWQHDVHNRNQSGRAMAGSIIQVGRLPKGRRLPIHVNRAQGPDGSMEAQMESINTVRKALLKSWQRCGPRPHEGGVKVPMPKGPFREADGPPKLGAASTRACAVRGGPSPADDRLGPGESRVVQP